MMRRCTAHIQKEDPVLTHYHYNILKSDSGKSKNPKHRSLHGKFISFFHLVNEIPEGETYGKGKGCRYR